MICQRRLGTIDLDTGEIIDGLNVNIAGRKNAFQLLYGWNFCLMAQNGMMKIAEDKDLTGETLRVFLYAVSKLDFENFLRLRQDDIAQGLGMQKANVSRAMKLLESKDILQRGPKIAQSYTWRMNPRYGFKGDPSGKLYKDKSGIIQFKPLKNS